LAQAERELRKVAFSHKTGIVFNSGIAPILEAEIEIQRAETREGRNQ